MMNRRNWSHIIKLLVDIRREEISQTSLMFAYNFLVIASYTIVKSIRDALFINQVGASKLPYVYIGIALIAGIMVQGYNLIDKRINRKFLIIGSNLFFTINIVAFWWLFRYKWSWLSYGIYIWGDIFIGISIAQFWLIANDLFNSRQAKRLFGFILSGGTLGGIIAGIASRKLVHTIGTENLFLITALLMLGCAVIIRWINFHEPVTLLKGSSNTPSLQNIGGAFALIRANKNLALLASIIGITLFVSTLIDFQFKNILQQTYKSKDALTSFFGIYYTYINVATILFQILVTGKLLRQFGVGIAVIIMPVVLFLGTAIVLFHPVLWAILIVKIGEDILRLSINKWGIEILYIPIPSSIKSKAKSFIDIVLERISRGLGGSILLVFTIVISLNIRQLSIPILALIAIWIFLCIRVYKEYITSIEATLQKRSLNIDNITVDLSDSSTMNLLIPLLSSKNERQIIYALELLQDAKNTELVKNMVLLCQHPSSEIKVKALRILFNIGDSQIVPQVIPLLKDENDEVRMEAIHYVSVYGEVPSVQQLQSFLINPDYKIKLAAISCIVNSGSDLERSLLTQDLVEQMMRENSPQRKLARLGAVRALGVLDNNYTFRNELLMELFIDTDINVVREAMLSAGKTKCADFVLLLVVRLDDPATRVTARDALVLYGPIVIEPLISMIANKQLPISIRRQIPKVISMVPYQESADALMNHLNHDEIDIRHKMIVAMSDINKSFSGIKFNTKLVEEYITKEIQGYYCLSIILQSQNDTISGLLRQALQERLVIIKEMIFLLLELIYPAESIYNAYRGLINHNTQIQANALELLDNILNNNIKQMLFPIFDSGSSAVFMRTASSLWNVQIMTEETAIPTLINGRDDWLKACAIYTVGEKGITDLYEHIKEACNSSNPIIHESAILALRKLTNSNN